MENIKCVRDDDTLRDQSFIDARSRTNRVINDSTDPNCSWGIISNSSGKQSFVEAEDLVSGLPWPPRSYTCTFCKREFRSAQALGGHMNVHRRDRARLRQMTSSQSFCSTYSTLLKLNQHPNPNFNPNFSSHFSSHMSPGTTILSPFTSSSAQLNSSYVSSSTSHPSYHLCHKGGENLTMMKSHVPGFGFCKLHGFPRDDEGKISMNSEIVRWNLESESKSDDLDLELRLGCS